LAILCRLLQLDLGLRQAYILLDRLGDDAPSITPAVCLHLRYFAGPLYSLALGFIFVHSSNAHPVDQLCRTL
jgi:hypothetical protein